MDYMHLLWGGAAFGAVAAAWRYVKVVLWKVCNLFLHQIEIHSEPCTEAVIGHLIQHYRRSGLDDSTYSAAYEHMKDGRYGLVPFELFGKRSIIFWNGVFPFFFTGPGQKQPTTPSTPASPSSPPGGADKKEACCTITYVRGTLNIDRMIVEATAQRNQTAWSVESETKSRQRRFFIKHIPDVSANRAAAGSGAMGWWFRMAQYRLLAHSPDDLGKQRDPGVSSLDNLIFPRRIKDLIEEIRLWRKHRDWYAQRTIPWKRGWLLYGPPGTGKTALARAFAEDLDLPIYAFNLAEITNGELVRAWTEMQQSVPCIALIEDIDNVFHGRECVARRGSFLSLLRPNRKKGKDKDDDDRDEGGGGMLSFDVFLNCLDGVERSDGVFTIITTNDIGKIDPALGQPRRLPDGKLEFISTRPGRIDKAIELGYMEPGDKRLMAKRILGEFEGAFQEMLEFLDQYPDLQETPAQFQERCAQIALACFWRQQGEAEAEGEGPAHRHGHANGTATLV